MTEYRMTVEQAAQRRLTIEKTARVARDYGRIERGRIAQTLQITLLDRLMKAMADLVPLGIVPVGFRANLHEGPVLLVEPLDDDVIDRNRLLVSGRYDGVSTPTHWFMRGYTRVEWEPGREGPTRSPAVDVEV